MKSNLSFFKKTNAFVVCAFGDKSKKSLPNPNVMKLLSFVFFLEFYIVLGLTIRSLIHFELIFAHGVS